MGENIRNKPQHSGVHAIIDLNDIRRSQNIVCELGVIFGSIYIVSSTTKK